MCTGKIRQRRKLKLIQEYSDCMYHERPTREMPYFFPWTANSIFWRFSSKSSELRKTLLAEFEIVCAISLAASIFLRVINAGLLAIAWPISWALVASPCQSQTGRNIFDEVVNSKVNYQAKQIKHEIISLLSSLPHETNFLGQSQG